MPRKSGNYKTEKPHWWTTDLDKSKRDLAKARRRKSQQEEIYKNIRNKHLSNIRSAKMRTWRDFCDTAKENVWGKAFRWAKGTNRKYNRPPGSITYNGYVTKSPSETAKAFLNVFVPSAEVRLGPMTRTTIVNRLEEASHDEIKNAIWSLKMNKAPGPDEVTAKILRKAWPVVKTQLHQVMNDCLREARFPNTWKVANIVVIPKGKDKDPAYPKSYRPISLISSMSKVLESLIIRRLTEETKLDEETHQHGFTKGRSTITAMDEMFKWADRECPNRHVLGVFLDITGAFDNMSWTAMLDDLASMGGSTATEKLLRSYLENRVARITVEGRTVEKEMTKGCPQGSRLGPTLWKVAIKKIMVTLNKDAPNSMRAIAYADDIALLAGASRKETAISRQERAIEELKKWAGVYGLTFSGVKTQSMSIRGGLKPGYTIRFGTGTDTETVTSTSPIKYLGVMVDYKRNFWEHILTVSQKSETLYSRVRGMMLANWGLGHTAAAPIYKAVFLPRCTYAASVWEVALKTKKAIAKLASVQRRPLLAITGAYRTVSTMALQVLAGTLPLDLEIMLEAARQNAAKGLVSLPDLTRLRNDALSEWQNRWDENKKGEWTKIMIPDIKVRYNLPMAMDHYTSQIMTGHGDFKGKLHQFKLVDSPQCQCHEGARRYSTSC